MRGQRPVFGITHHSIVHVFVSHIRLQQASFENPLRQLTHSNSQIEKHLVTSPGFIIRREKLGASGRSTPLFSGLIANLSGLTPYASNASCNSLALEILTPINAPPPVRPISRTIIAIIPEGLEIAEKNRLSDSGSPRVRHHYGPFNLCIVPSL